LGVFDSLIMAACIGSSGVQHDACTKALEAGGNQSGIERNVDTYEKRKLENAKESAISYLGKDSVNVVGGTAWLAKVMIDRKATVRLPNFGICDGLTTEVDEKLARLVFQWKF